MPLGYRHTAETKRKMSIAKSNPSAETRKNMSEAQKGKKHSAETRRKIGIGNKGKKLSAETRRKISKANKGHKHSVEHCKNMSLARKGKKLSAEHRKKMSLTAKGKKKSAEHCKNISIAKKGRKHSAEHRKNNGLAHKGKKLSAETRKKISLAGSNPSAETRKKLSLANKGKKLSAEHIRKISGENSPHWRGGIAYDPYCGVWSDEEYRESIFDRDNNECQNPHCSGTSKWLTLHHIDYDKGNCNPKNILTLCNSCNSIANYNREWHTAFYQEIIRRKYLKLKTGIKLNRRKIKLNRRCKTKKGKSPLRYL